MAIDLSIVAPKARENYLRIGRRFGSTDTIKQANKTLEGCENYIGVLKLYGFNIADMHRLADARQGLIAAGVDRSEQVGHNKVTNRAFVAALTHGKEARQTARSILHGARDKLLENGNEAIAREIEVALEQTRTSQDDPEKLATQLDLLRKTLNLGPIAHITDQSGGPEAIAELGPSASALRDSAQEKTGGSTVAATENIDILDGIIVTLARNARKAARAAARKLRQPALAAAFELSHLYDNRSTSSTNTPSTTPTSTVP